MRGNLWTLVVMAIGSGLMLRAAGAAQPADPAGSTADVAGLFSVIAPFAGQLLALAGVGALLFYAFRIS